MTGTALPLGTRIEKTGSVPGDGHRDGAKGRICKPPHFLGEALGVFRTQHYLGPSAVPIRVDDGKILAPGMIFYFIEWDDIPGLQVGITSDRIRKVEEGRAA